MKKEYHKPRFKDSNDVLSNNFNSDKYCKNKYGKKEIKEALNSGQSTDDIQKQIDSYQNDTGTKVGLKAQAFLDKKISQMK